MRKTGFEIYFNCIFAISTKNDSALSLVSNVSKCIQNI